MALYLQALTRDELRSCSDQTRELAGVGIQLRDMRAKAATDTGDSAQSQKLLTIDSGLQQTLSTEKPQPVSKLRLCCLVGLP